MQKQYNTARLSLDELTLNDVDFIFELVNLTKEQAFLMYILVARYPEVKKRLPKS